MITPGQYYEVERTPGSDDWRVRVHIGQYPAVRFINELTEVEARTIAKRLNNLVMGQDIEASLGKLQAAHAGLVALLARQSDIITDQRKEIERLWTA